MDPDAEVSWVASVAEFATILTCHVCGHSSAEIMPTDRCVYFYEGPSCRTTVKPKAGDLDRLWLIPRTHGDGLRCRDFEIVASKSFEGSASSEADSVRAVIESTSSCRLNARQ